MSRDRRGTPAARAPLLALLLTLACGSPAPTPPDASHVEPPFPYCYGASSYPTCADGSYRFEDWFCNNFGTANQQCTSRGDGRCYPVCKVDGDCEAGKVCGCLGVSRCTHYNMTLRVCTSPELRCPGPDAGVPSDAGG